MARLSHRHPFLTERVSDATCVVLPMARREWWTVATTPPTPSPASDPRFCPSSTPLRRFFSEIFWRGFSGRANTVSDLRIRIVHMRAHERSWRAVRGHPNACERVSGRTSPGPQTLVLQGFADLDRNRRDGSAATQRGVACCRLRVTRNDRGHRRHLNFWDTSRRVKTAHSNASQRGNACNHRHDVFRYAVHNAPIPRRK